MADILNFVCYTYLAYAIVKQLPKTLSSGQSSGQLSHHKLMFQDCPIVYAVVSSYFSQTVCSLVTSHDGSFIDVLCAS